jgi:hypothetical protein
MRIIETDNFGGDYPDEKFLNLPVLPAAHCTRIAAAINEALGKTASRYYRVVDDDYVLQPGFEP